ncbi:MAG: glutamate--cysteine ligase [Candidatus Nanopelagicales bacterium]
MEFNASPRNTLGVEVEIGIVDQTTHQLVSRSNEVLEVLQAPYDGEHPKAKHEFYQSSIEVITGICETVEEAGLDLRETFDEVDAVLESKGLQLQAGGLHPMADWEDLKVTDQPRYLNFAERIQWPARRSMCHGIHYHVGVQSADASVAIANSVAVQMPEFIALSASSPFWHGSATGLASSRTKVFEAMPTNDLPPKLSGWDEFTTLMDVLIKGGAIESVRELWWDIRPHPGFGTVELRMSDAMGTMREVLALAALAQCLVYDLSRKFEAGEELPWLLPWILKQNKWRAARFGLDTDIIVSNEGDNRPLRDLVKELVEELQPAAEILGCTKELADVLLILEHGNGASRQLAEYQRSGDLSTVADQLVREWQTNQPTGW